MPCVKTATGGSASGRVNPAPPSFRFPKLTVPCGGVTGEIVKRWEDVRYPVGGYSGVHEDPGDPRVKESSQGETVPSAFVPRSLHQREKQTANTPPVWRPTDYGALGNVTKAIRRLAVDSRVPSSVLRIEQYMRRLCVPGQASGDATGRRSHSRRSLEKAMLI